MIITQEINVFREALRHLWNSYLRIGADWDTVDMFCNIFRMLFSKHIVSRLEINAPPIPVDDSGEYIPQYRIIMEGSGKLPLLVNRDIPPSGSWDHPTHWIPPEVEYDIRPISFFDYDVIGWRMLEFYRARIVNCESKPELIGRDALIRCDYVDIEVVD